MDNMKRIIVTPAGRKRYLKVLLNHLISHRDEFDSWHIWENTENEEDKEYISKIASENDFIIIKKLTVKLDGNRSISSFYKDCIKPNEIYLKLDDDIVFIGKHAIKIMFDEREKDNEHFLLFGNTINNAVVSHLQQKIGNFTENFGVVGYNCMDKIGWKCPRFATYVHETFIKKFHEKKLSDLTMSDWILKKYEHVSINAICWRGDEFAKFNGAIEGWDEPFLSTKKPKSINKPNKIIGNALFVHFAFFTQREVLDNTNLLKEYELISTMEQ